MYRASLGRTTDIGSQYGKACCPCSRLGLRGNVLFLLFLQFHSLGTRYRGDKINWDTGLKSCDRKVHST